VEIPLVALQLAQQEVYRDKGSERKNTFKQLLYIQNTTCSVSFVFELRKFMEVTNPSIVL